MLGPLERLPFSLNSKYTRCTLKTVTAPAVKVRLFHLHNLSNLVNMTSYSSLYRMVCSALNRLITTYDLLFIFSFPKIFVISQTNRWEPLVYFPKPLQRCKSSVAMFEIHSIQTSKKAEEALSSIALTGATGTADCEGKPRNGICQLFYTNNITNFLIFTRKNA